MRRVAVLRTEARGSVLPLVALTLGTFLGFGALVTDVGFLYLQRRLLQSAADAAALAGVRELPQTPGAAQEIAAQYAAHNGVAAPADTVQTLVTQTYVNNDSLQVNLRRTAPLFLARALGNSQREVTASSTAVIGVLGATKGVMPFGVVNPANIPGCDPIKAFCFQFGQLYNLKLGPGGQVNGNFQALAIDGSGANIYRQTIKNGSRTGLVAGSYVPTQTGNMAGPTEQGLRDRIGSNTQTFRQVVQPPQGGSSYTLLDPSSPRLVLVPIIRELVDPSQDVFVQGFALFFIEDFETQANDTYIQGYFINATQRIGEFAPLTTDFGTRKVKLLQ